MEFHTTRYHEQQLRRSSLSRCPTQEEMNPKIRVSSLPASQNICPELPGRAQTSLLLVLLLLWSFSGDEVRIWVSYSEIIMMMLLPNSAIISLIWLDISPPDQSMELICFGKPRSHRSEAPKNWLSEGGILSNPSHFQILTWSDSWYQVFP